MSNPSALSSPADPSTGMPLAALPPSAVYRIATLDVPAAARTAFLDRAAIVKARVAQQPGLIAQAAYERRAGPGRFNFVTIAAWIDQAALDAADAAITGASREDGVDRAAFTAAHGIVTEIATFGPVEA